MPRYSFSGHQTFPFRYSWPTKGVAAAEESPTLFSGVEAMVELGVGKNMVASMRHWIETLGLAASSGKGMHVLPLGRQVFGPEGWDPFLEDVGTLWLLHWQLVHSPHRASTWHLAFTRWGREVFTRSELVGWLSEIATRDGNRRVSRASIRRDVDVFVRTYVPARPDKRRPMEDSFDCPLVELGLLRELEDGVYQFRKGAQPSLPVEIFTYAVAEFWDATSTDQDTMSFERLMYGVGCPGNAFKLSESACVALLEQLPKGSGLAYDETAGLRTVLRRSRVPASDRAEQFLGAYYQRRSNEQDAA